MAAFAPLWGALLRQLVGRFFLHEGGQPMNTIMLRAKGANGRGIILMMLATSLVMFCAQSGWAQAGPQSDSLFVNYGLAVNQTIPVPQPAVEGAPEGIADVQVTDNPTQFPLLNPGYITIFEPDGTTLSDILVSHTGSSLQLYSDGSQGFPPDLTGLQQLARFNETANGITVPVGNFFGTAANPIGANQIVVFSDGNVPEPGTLLLFATGLGRPARLRMEAKEAGGSISGDPRQKPPDQKPTLFRVGFLLRHSTRVPHALSPELRMHHDSTAGATGCHDRQ
jgi:hypothetical protein